MRSSLTSGAIGVAVLALAALAVLPGCDDGRLRPDVDVVSVPEGLDARFTVRRAGAFRAGYDSHKREMLVIRDEATGIEYLAITGCGATELRERRVGKNRVVTNEE
jgi:hypothetical protein